MQQAWPQIPAQHTKSREQLKGSVCYELNLLSARLERPARGPARLHSAAAGSAAPPGPGQAEPGKKTSRRPQQGENHPARCLTFPSRVLTLPSRGLAPTEILPTGCDPNPGKTHRDFTEGSEHTHSSISTARQPRLAPLELEQIKAMSSPTRYALLNGKRQKLGLGATQRGHTAPRSGPGHGDPQLMPASEPPCSQGPPRD
ncbi:hypothetical protein Anapl_00539 [Anas platyrhynchos]|uniref:Uncharacterized protein n=1 Tax=Anas platyrhynchos TaxID=8839 RepID=R0LJT2_ANAPL|nr:hypothetical protein Anapl_00539 [Anas platyrhynchos]